jgi:hypothetical protein
VDLGCGNPVPSKQGVTMDWKRMALQELFTLAVDHHRLEAF